MPELSNYRRELFCRYYLKTGGNQTRSAILAGYAPRSAHVQGHRAIMDDKVKARLKELKEADYSTKEITPELITKAMWKGYTESDHPRDQKGFLDSLARVRGMFTDNLNQGNNKDMATVLEVLRGIVPEDQRTKLARQFGVELNQTPPAPTHEATESVN